MTVPSLILSPPSSLPHRQFHINSEKSRRVKLQSLQFYINSKTIELQRVKSVIILSTMVEIERVECSKHDFGAHSAADWNFHASVSWPFVPATPGTSHQPAPRGRGAKIRESHPDSCAHLRDPHMLERHWAPTLIFIVDGANAVHLNRNATFRGTFLLT